MITARNLCLSLAALVIAVSSARAETFTVETILTPKQVIRLDFEDGSKHFVAMVRREGQASGSGPLAGASVMEYGMHDIVPGVGGDPRGYLVFTNAGGDKAYLRFLVRAIFVDGPGGKPRLIDNGFWELVGGTGGFKGRKGTGVIKITAVSKTDRKFTLDGEIVP